jgi:hypothetical protein
MAIILFNPTDEILKAQYIGEDVIIPPAPDPMHKVRVDDARGRHVLNVLGPRGLVTLEYGDEGDGEEKKAAQGRARNAEFKRKHVMNFNQVNDSQAQRKLPYVTPDETTKRYARQLGIKLYEPMSSTDDMTQQHAELMGKVAEKDRELNAKAGQISELSAKVDKLSDLVTALLAAKGPETNWDDLKSKIKAINGKHFQTWVATNFTEIQGYPDDVKGLISERYEKFYSVPFPANEQEARAAA